MRLVKYHSHALAALRIALGGIMLWFGVLAALDPAGQFFWLAPWVQALPLVGTAAFVFVLGVTQVVVGLALVLGTFVRPAALLAAALLFGIIVNLGFQEIAMRDFVILCAALVLATTENHRFALRP